MSINPDPSKYVIRFRKGKPVLFEKENLEAIKRWRERRAKLQLAEDRKTLHNALGGLPLQKQDEDRGRVAKIMPNLFEDDI